MKEDSSAAVPRETVPTTMLLTLAVVWLPLPGLNSESVELVHVTTIHRGEPRVSAKPGVTA